MVRCYPCLQTQVRTSFFFLRRTKGVTILWARVMRSCDSRVTVDVVLKMARILSRTGPIFSGMMKFMIDCRPDQSLGDYME